MQIPYYTALTFGFQRKLYVGNTEPRLVRHEVRSEDNLTFDLGYVVNTNVTEMASQFSKDGRYFAQISTEGKLKVWATSTSSFEQEFTPDFHLRSPCTCLHFLQDEPPKIQVIPPPNSSRKILEMTFCDCCRITCPRKRNAKTP